MSTKKKTPWYVLEATYKRPTKPKVGVKTNTVKTESAFTKGKAKVSSGSKAFLEEISHSVKEIMQEKKFPAGAVIPTTNSNYHLNSFISYKHEGNTQYLFIIKKEDETTTAAVIDFNTGKIQRLPYLPLSFKEGYRVAQNQAGQQAIMDAWMSEFIVPFGDYKLKLKKEGNKIAVLATVGDKITQFDLKPAEELEEKYSSLAEFNHALQEAVQNKPSKSDSAKEEKVRITFTAETDYTILCSATMADEQGSAHLDLMSMELNPLAYHKVYPSVGGYRVVINDKKEQAVVTANGMETKVDFVPCSLALFESRGEIEVIAIIGNKTTSFPLENLEKASGPSIKDKYDGPEDFLSAIEALSI